MNEYEELLEEAFLAGVLVSEKYAFKSNVKGLTVNNKIKLSNKLQTLNEKKCILAEELAHHKLNHSDITDLRNIENKRQEDRAHKAAILYLVPFTRLIETVISLKDEATNYNVADALGITEEYLKEALEIYHRAYGDKVDIGSYIVSFSPFNIREKHK